MTHRHTNPANRIPADHPVLLHPHLHLDAAPPAPLLEDWPPGARPGRDVIRVALDDPRWVVQLAETPSGVRWTLGLEGVGAIAGGIAPAV